MFPLKDDLLGGIARGKLYEQENTSNYYPMF